jgi:hypothetical protein
MHGTRPPVEDTRETIMITSVSAKIMVIKCNMPHDTKCQDQKTANAVR